MSCLLFFSLLFSNHFFFISETDILVISDLTSLEYLDVSHNKITSLTPLSGMKSLKVLRCNNNSLTDMEVISKLSSIEELWLNNNHLRMNMHIELLLLIFSHIFVFIRLCLYPSSYLLALLVDWSQTIYFQPLLNLRCIIILDNPACTKPKIYQFISALCGRQLQSINGREVQNKNFLKTVDGRVMLTQARATLTSDQRNGLILGKKIKKCMLHSSVCMHT